MKLYIDKVTMLDMVVLSVKSEQAMGSKLSDNGKMVNKLGLI